MPESTLQQAEALAVELRDQPALTAREAVTWVEANNGRTDVYVTLTRLQAADAVRISWASAGARTEEGGAS